MDSATLDSAAPESTYQLCLYVGAAPELSQTRMVEVAPASASAEAILEALALSEITPSDLRARAAVSFDAAVSPALAVLVYTAITGFAGRYLDVLVTESVIEPSALLRASASQHSERPSSQPSLVLVGASHAEIPSVFLDHQLSTEEASSVRWSRRLRFVPASDLTAALSQFVVISALRNRNSVERLPYLCDGSESYDEAAPTEVVGIDLDALRLAALALRRTSRSGDRDTILEALVPTERDNELQRAAELSIEDTLRRLGALQNPDTGLWHCPRPSRHTHGDATASMKVQNDRVRCFRCDKERLDSLRLTMDVTGLSPDEAAAWLLSPAA